MRPLLFLILLCSCSKTSETLRTSGIVWEGKKVVFIGDSITSGSSASSPQKRWSWLFCASKGSIEINLGIPGEVLQDGNRCDRRVFDKSTIPSYSDDYAALFVALGINDIGFNNGSFSPEGYRLAINDLIEYAVRERGWRYNDIVLVTPYYISKAGYGLYVGFCGVDNASGKDRHEKYNEVVSSVSKSKGCILADVYSAMLEGGADELISTHGIHPNDKGYAFIARHMSEIKY